MSVWLMSICKIHGRVPRFRMHFRIFFSEFFSPFFIIARWAGGDLYVFWTEFRIMLLCRWGFYTMRDFFSQVQVLKFTTTVYAIITIGTGRIHSYGCPKHESIYILKPTNSPCNSKSTSLSIKITTSIPKSEWITKLPRTM